MRKEYKKSGGEKTIPSGLKRYESIDIARSFAIILVVIGHFKSEYLPRFYNDIVIGVIYMFHMPLFMFVSGFLYQATRRPITYRKFIEGKFRRLMVPYFTVSILLILLKIGMSGILPLEHPVTWKSFVEILYYPSAGYFLWFIWALWWMMVIIPAFKTEMSRKVLLALSVIAFFYVPVLPDIFCIDKFAGMLVFFVGGTVVADYMRSHKIESFSILGQVVSVVVFAVLAWLIIEMGNEDRGVAKAILVLVANISGIAMSMSVAFWWRIRQTNRVLDISYSIAGASYIIYLLHTTFEGFAKGLLLKLHWFDNSPRIVFAWAGAAVIVGAGVVIPWWLATKVLNRHEFISFLFGIRPKTATCSAKDIQ